MDVTTISALAAAGAAVGALSVAGVQLYVGHRQSEAALKSRECSLMNAQSAGRHIVAVFRQSWIDKVIDALSDYHAILMSIGDGHSLSPDDHRKLTALWTGLELLLNPDESDAVSLLKLADAARQSQTVAEHDSKARDMVQLARNLVQNGMGEDFRVNSNSAGKPVGPQPSKMGSCSRRARGPNIEIVVSASGVMR